MTAANSRIGIDFLSVLGMPPVEFIAFAASLDCPNISLAPQPMTDNPHGYPAWSLRGNVSLQAEVKAALAANGVRIAIAEGVIVRPGQTAADFLADLDVFAALGVPQANLCVLAPGMEAVVSALVEAARTRGMGAAVEFVPGTGVPTLAAALALAAATPGLRLVIDLMHVFRSGSSAADLAAIDPALIAHVQICDTPWTNAAMSYGVEALHHRLPPGDGELPLAEALAVLPTDVVVSLELPMLSRAEAGEGPRERLDGAVATTRAMLVTAQIGR